MHVTGFVYDYLGNDVPAGYLDADGAEHLIANYPDLFAVLGNRWGGDGVTTFKVPDIRGRNTIGNGTGSDGLTARDLGTKGGVERVELQRNELPPHTHQPAQDAFLRFAPGGTGQFAAPPAGNDLTTGISLATVGNYEKHENMPPYMVVRKLIKT
jgi:microcystin-dependent protein